MNIKQSILVIFTIIFFLMSVIFITFEVREIPKDQNGVIDNILEKISPEIKEGKLSNETISKLPPDYFYAIWIENNDESWIPLIVDANLNINQADGPTWIPAEFNWSIRTYLKTVNELNFMVWINKYNSEFYIKNVILVSLFLLLFYLVLVLVISLLFFDYGKKAQIFDEESDFRDIYDKSDLDPTIVECKNNEKLEDQQNIKTSDNEITESKDNKDKIIENEVSKNVQKQEDFATISGESQDEISSLDLVDKGEKEEMSENLNIELNSILQNDNNHIQKNDCTNEEKQDEIMLAKEEHSDKEAKDETIQKINEDEKKEESSNGLLSKAEKIVGDESFVYEHKIDGDKIASVKFTDEEYQALTQPIEYDGSSSDEEEDFFAEEEKNKWEKLDLSQKAHLRYEALVTGYKRLWGKTIKMSDDFKSKFNFFELKSLIRLGCTANDYCKNSLDIGLQYFGWEESDFFIGQDNQFVSITTGQKLEMDNLDIPTKGDKKGQMYIPLFPFDGQNLFGFMYLKWTKITNFKLTDLLCYLQLVFVKDSCFIFDDTFQRDVFEIVGKHLNKGKETIFGLLVADNLEKIIDECSNSDVGALNQEINKKLQKDFKKFDVIPVTPLKFALVSSKWSKEKGLKIFDKWICNAEKTTFAISALQKCILSFSCGVAFKSDNAENLASEKNLMERAECLLRVSVNEGGNKISIQK